MLNGVELARWEFGPDAPRLMVTPPLPLPAGISRLTLECDGEERLGHGPDGQPIRGPSALLVVGLTVVPAAPPADRLAEHPGDAGG